MLTSSAVVDVGWRVKCDIDNVAGDRDGFGIGSRRREDIELIVDYDQGSKGINFLERGHFDVSIS